MNPLDPQSETIALVELNRVDRWQVCLRLWELAIPCRCDPDQPLKVQVNNATAAVQLWSVIKQLTSSRSELVNWLERCWEDVSS